MTRRSNDGGEGFATPANGSAVRVRGLRKRFGTHRSQGPAVLDGIDLDVTEGEFVSVIGPSGCGKSTLLSILAGLESANAGAIEVDRERLAFVFQRPLLLPWRTVLGNATFALECSGRRGRDVRDEARRLLERAGLGDVVGYKPHELSVGMRQRVDLVRALLVNPTLLLMDEPFASLDKESRESLHVELEHASQETGVTVLLVSHDLEEVATLSDRIVVLSDKPTRVRCVVEVGLPRPRATDMEGRLAQLRRPEQIESEIRRLHS